VERARRRLNQALVLYRQDVDRIERALAAYREASKAQCSLLVDLDGHLVTHSGDLVDVDVDALAALVAGSFLAMREVARCLGEDDFATLLHEGDDECVQLALVDERTVLATVHAPEQAGLVAFFAKHALARIGAVLDDIWTRKPEPVEGFPVDLGDAFDFA
jgi:predicted regulator of Ras-like GTPase activity (Roadblock/LC7/MglB family)